MKKLLTLTLALFLTAPGFLFAQVATPLFEDQAIEQRLVKISGELRCLVCQNESLVDSRAELAVALRREIREMMQQGMSDQQIKDFLVSRYGEFVLFSPRLKPSTWLLWLGPFVMLFGGLAYLVYFVRRRRRMIVDAPLSDEERKRAADLLQGGQS